MNYIRPTLPKKQRLITAIYTYLSYDHKEDLSFKNPFDKELCERRMEDAEKIADICEQIMKE